MSVTEAELAERATGKRVSLEDIQRNVMFEFFFTAADGVRGVNKDADKMLGRAESLERLTFCTLVMRNGFVVTGESACADPANYKKDIGERLAYDQAIKKVWGHMGYELCSQLTSSSQ